MSNLIHHEEYNLVDSGYWSAHQDRASQHATVNSTSKQSAPWSLFNTRSQSQSCSIPVLSSFPKTISCSHCDTQFTGTYGRGNLARHIRNKHTEANNGTYACTVNGCSKIFQRQDARLKHERKRHIGLHHRPPEQRRQLAPHTPSNDRCLVALNSKSNEHALNEVDLPVERQLLGIGSGFTAEEQGPDESLPQLWQSMSYAIHDHPQTARIIFSHMYENLNEDGYSRFCDRFFMRWESIVQQLYNINSNAYAPYAQVLVEIYAVVHELDSTAPSRVHGNIDQATASGIRSRPDHFQHNRSRRNVDLGSCSTDSSSSSKIQTPSNGPQGHQSHKSRPEKSATVIQCEKLKQPKSKGIDCPIYKHHLMHNTPSPCNGCSRDVMSQVRSHIKRGPHGGFPPFLEQCSRCKEDFVDEQLLSNHKVLNQCEHRPQLRGDIIIPWAQLYLTVYPNAHRVPRPYTNEIGWLPDNITTQCRSINRTSAPLHSLPDENNLVSQDLYTQSQFMDNNNLGHSAALNHVLMDSLNLAVRTPSQQLSFPGTQIPTPGDNVAEVTYGPEDYLSYLNNTSNSYLQSLADAPMHVTPEHLRFVVLQAEAIIRNVLLYQARQPEQGYATGMVSSAPYYHSHPIQNINFPYSPPSQQQHPQAGWEGTRGGWDMSTQPSSHGVDSDSAPYFESTLPSTAPDPVNPTLFSPSNPHNYYQASLVPPVMPDMSQHRQTSSNFHASPLVSDTQPDVPSYNDPLLFSTDYGVDFDVSYDILQDVCSDNGQFES